MKTLILFLIFSFNASAITEAVLDDNYPGFHDYAAISFGPVKGYFRKLINKSVVVNGENGPEELQVQDSDRNIIQKIKVQIVKTQSENTITEVINYSFDSGKKLTITLMRKGQNVKFDSDLNLLLFKFDPIENEETFDLVIPEFQIQYHRDNSLTQDNSYYILQFMELNMEINTQITSSEINRDYIFFYAGMPIPQQQLTVNVKEANDTWKEFEFLHYTRSNGIITPKLFFEGLNSASNIFIGASQFYIGKLLEVGFPKFD
jgi:hypothetical protein